MTMKKIICLAAAFALLCGCSAGGKNGGASPDGSVSAWSAAEGDYPAHFEYKYVSETNEHFAVSPDGRLIVTILNKDDFSCDIMGYDMDGSGEKLCKLAYYPEAMAFMGSDIYVAGTWDKETKIEKLDLATGKTEPYVTIPLVFCRSMSGSENELYIIGEGRAKSGMKCGDPGYGNINLSVYRVKNGEAELLPVDFPTSVCAKKSGGAVIAACDDEGFYISQYDGETFGEKLYNASAGANGRISTLADVDGTHIVISVFTASQTYNLCAADMNSFYLAELIPDKAVGKEIFTAGDYCFFSSGTKVTEDDNGTSKRERTIERIKFSEYYNYNPPLNFIRSEYTSGTPFGCGYVINITDPSTEETALKILSQDKDYDLCYVNTRTDISYAIKKQGSFYPLNDVPGVKEYMDECFPAIRAAFTDENGDIWALPVRAHSFYLFSNYGDNDFSQMKLSEFVDFVDGLSDEELICTDYSAFTYTEQILADYAMKHDSFDTPEFRAAAEKLKGSKRLNNSVEKSYRHAYVIFGENGDGRYDYENDDGKRLFSMFYDSETFINRNGYKVSGLPAVSESNVFEPEVYFISVNPASSKLDDALGYISALAGYLLTQKNSFVFSDEKYYSDTDTAKSVIALNLDPRTKVRFTLPSELYWNDFHKYLAGEISLDDFIREADRKLKIYLNE